jgi:hypothetical protein
MSLTPLEFIQAHHSEMLHAGVTSYHILPYEVDLFVQGLIPMFRIPVEFEEVKANLYGGGVHVAGIRVEVADLVRVKMSASGRPNEPYNRQGKYSKPPQYRRAEPKTTFTPPHNYTSRRPTQTDDILSEMERAHQEFMRKNGWAGV